MARIYAVALQVEAADNWSPSTPHEYMNFQYHVLTDDFHKAVKLAEDRAMLIAADHVQKPLVPVKAHITGVEITSPSVVIDSTLFTVSQVVN